MSFESELGGTVSKGCYQPYNDNDNLYQLDCQ